MHQTTFKYILGLFLATAFIWGCRNEPETQPDNLTGYWEIRDAFRNGRQTESLDELYFEFFMDGIMRTNISGIPEEAAYELNGKKIEQRESEMAIDYTIQELTDTTLTLTTTIRDFDFRFELNKRIPQE